MAKKRSTKPPETYPKAMTELRPVIVGWIHRCEWCGEEFQAKKQTGARYCPAPKICRVQAHRAGHRG